MSTIYDLKEKIHSLEAERLRLASEVEMMRKAAENRAIALEEDVSQLREESKTLREVLFYEEKIGVAGSTSKPVAVAKVEENTKTEPEVHAQTLARERANDQVFVSKPVVAPSVDAIPQNVSDISEQELGSEKSEAKSEVPRQDDGSKTLTAEERKIVDILCNHGGRYGRANIRAEAGLGWLQTNRVISHLAERGVIGLEKSGASLELVLKEKLE